MIYFQIILGVVGLAKEIFSYLTKKEKCKEKRLEKVKDLKITLKKVNTGEVEDVSEFSKKFTLNS